MTKKTVKKSSDRVPFISAASVAGIDTYAGNSPQALKYKDLQQTRVDPQATCDRHVSIFDAPPSCHEKRAPKEVKTETPLHRMGKATKESTTLLGSNS